MSDKQILIPRRSFLRGLNLALGGLAVGYSLPTLAQKPTNEPGKPPGPKPSPGSNAIEAKAPGLNPNVFVHIGPDGVVTIVCHRSEMGQGVRSTLPVLIADELGADMARVKILQGDGDKAYGDQNTDGSSSVRKGLEDLRKAGAAARLMLIAAAAKRWRVLPETCTTHDHAVFHSASARSLKFGELVADAAKLPVPKVEKEQLRPKSELHHVGTELPLLDAPGIV